MFLKNKKWLLAAGYAVVCFLSMISGIFLNSMNHFWGGCLFAASGIGLYFFAVFFIADRNWLDLRAVFVGVWFVTVGMASMRMTGYQEEWQKETWVLFALSLIVFLIGASFGIEKGHRWYSKWRDKAASLGVGRLRFSFCENRLFWICIATTVIGIACFSANVAVKGFIPCFSSSTTAYMDFYTKFHIFSVASVGVSGLCYYCIKTQKLSLWKKTLLFLCIFYETILFPILVVSRGVFVVSALSLTVVVFYLHRKRFLALLLCLVVIFGIYAGCSQLRNYSDSYLSTVFDPIWVNLGQGNSSPDDLDHPENPGDEDFGFTLPPKVVFLYSYLTVSHDNFNEAVQNTKEYTYGLRQLQPFNVILRSGWLEETVENAEVYFVTPNLNTYNVLGDFYYDFGAIGVVVLLLLWSFVFGLNQGMYEKGKGVFVLLLLGNTMVPVAMSFFSAWLSIFSHWMLWGVVLLFAFAACVQWVPKKEETSK